MSDTLVPHLRRARDLADRAFGEPLDLTALASAAAVSKSHFVRQFAATYGETPVRYLTRRRIERAQDLIRSANLTVTEVSLMVGFPKSGFVHVAIQGSGRRHADAVPRPVGHQRRQPRAGLFPLYARYRPLADQWSNFGEALRRGPAYCPSMITCISLATVWVNDVDEVEGLLHRQARIR